MIRINFSDLRTCIENYVEDNQTWADAEVQIMEDEENVLIFVRMDNLLTKYTVGRLESWVIMMFSLQ